MKPEIIKADTAGMIVSWDNGNDVYYVGSSCPPFGNGVCYKDKQAFDDQQGICYVNEYGFYDEVAIDENVSDEMLKWMRKHNEWYVCMDDRGYTWDDLRDEVYRWIGNQLDFLDDHTYDLFVDYMQERLFDECDWQSPYTWLSELDPIEQWENCPQLSCEDPRFLTIGQCLDRVLEDDDKCNGGTAFVGETLRDFLLSVNMGTLEDVIMDAKVSSLDKLLTDNGIKPIR